MKWDEAPPVQAQGPRTPQGEPSGQGLAAYAKLIEDYAKFGRYEEAVRLVKRMAGLREPASRRRKRTRNFMKLL